MLFLQLIRFDDNTIFEQSIFGNVLTAIMTFGIQFDIIIIIILWLLLLFCNLRNTTSREVSKLVP